MYCKYCGKQVDEDATFCKYCGKSLANDHKNQVFQQNVSKVTNQTKDEDGDSKASGCGWILILLPIIVAIIAVISIIGPVLPDFNTPTILTRDITRSDYTYQTKQGLTDYQITITPNIDIENCDVQLTLYNSKGETIYADTISKTKLKEGLSYTYTFDFGISGALSGSKINIKITGKCKYTLSQAHVLNNMMATQ